MRQLELLIPPPIVLIVFAAPVAYLTKIGTGYFEPLSRYSFIYLSLFVIAIAVAVAGIIEFNKSKTTVNPHNPQDASSLVTSGIYRWTRNPMYLGLSLFFLALTLKMSNLYGFVALLLFMLYLTRFQIIPEEKAIEKLFGDEYLNYKKSVRRWI